MIYPTITALTAGILVILQMILMIYTGMGRYRYGQGLGDGGHVKLLARIRSHGNLTENAPIILIVLGLLEMANVDTFLVAGAAGLFVVARLLHPLGLLMTDGTSLPRALGVLGTVLTGIGGGLFLIYMALEKLAG